MFVPKQYRVPDAVAARILWEHPFALLVTNGPERPRVTHLPVVVPTDERAQLLAGAPFKGRSLYGHLNRANPHWLALAEAGTCTLIFQGPESYVSPTHYGKSPAAPTWDFTAVHLHGVVHVISDREQLLSIVKKTVTSLEQSQGGSWDMGESIPYFEQIIDGVGGFRFEITGGESMFKVSQEQPAEVRERLCRALLQGGDQAQAKVAEIIRGQGKCPAAAMRDRN